MAPQVDRRITRIGMEGFGLVEDGYGRHGRSGKLPSTTTHQLHQSPHQHQHQYQHHQQTLIYHGPQVSTVRIPAVINCNEVAQYYGGVEKEPVITSDEAAQYYGGFVIVEHGRKKPFRSVN